MDQQKEIVFTYRQEEQAEEVVLRLARDLPARMRAPETVPADRAEDPFDGADGCAAPWRSAIDPPERRKKGGWGTKLFVGVSLLAALVCLGLGIWYVGDYGWTLPGNASRDSGGGGYLPPSEDFFYYDREDPGGKPLPETTIARYPVGGETRLALHSAGDLQVLSPGEVFDKVNPSVVTVLGKQGQYASVGTGVILSADGYLLTNAHVIAGCRSCEVWVSGDYGSVDRYPARLVGCDEDTDLAVLKIEAWDLPAAEFGVSDDLLVGDPVYAIGNPLGTELLNTFTNGIVSAINRDVNVDGVNMTLIQTNVALNSGNSGGPLINKYGQVVGVNTIKMMSEEDTIEGLGFAIPSSLAERWVNELIELGELRPQPVLGITITRRPRELPDGTVGVVLVDDVTPGGSGDRAGILPEDYIVSFAGEPITSAEQIYVIRRSLFVGDKVEVRVYRSGEYLDLTMTMRAASTQKSSQSPVIE